MCAMHDSNHAGRLNLEWVMTRQTAIDGDGQAVNKPWVTSRRFVSFPSRVQR